MTSHPLDYSPPARLPLSRWVVFLAHLTFAYPILFAASLYGQWLLAWYMLGNPPRPSIDDPQDIPGSNWLHPMVGLAFVGLIPAAIAGIAFNLFYVIYNGRIAIRFLGMLALWVGVILLLRADPGNVVNWWFD